MRLFISYSHRDQAPAGRLIADFQQAGLHVWYDQQLQGGHEWWRTILGEIRECDVFVLLLSDSALASKPCMAELAYARALRLPVLPVQIGPVGNIRTSAVADIQVVDGTQRSVESVLALIGAVNDAAAERGPLPDPLPEPPAVPFGYLVRLGSAIGAEELGPHDQAELIHQLRECLETEEDEGVREDARELLRALSRRPDVTNRVAQEIEQLLGGQDAETVQTTTAG